jgi:hypothetical protein
LDYARDSVGTELLLSERFTNDPEVIEYFTEGQCNALAYELHMLRGHTIAMVSDNPKGSDDYMGHLFVIDSEANAIDIEGCRPLEDLRESWDFLPRIYRFFTLADFELEMTLWDNKIHYTKDREAKKWARIIDDILG